jgi:hypothetical protein
MQLPSKNINALGKQNKIDKYRKSKSAPPAAAIVFCQI